MDNFTGTILTDAGLAWQADVDAGLYAPVFTRAVMGDTALPVGDPAALTALPDARLTHRALSVRKGGQQVARVEAAFDNRELDEGFFVRWIGLYARSAGDSEVLVAVSVSGERPDFLPTMADGSLIESIHAFLIVVGRASSVTIDGGALSGFVLREDYAELEKRVAALEAGQIVQDERIDMLYSLLTNSIPGAKTLVHDAKKLSGMRILDGVWDEAAGVVYA